MPIVVQLLASLALLALPVVVFWGLGHLANTLEQGLSRDLDEDVARRVRDLEHQVDLLPQRWEEMVKEAKRAEARSRAAARRALEELEEHGLRDPNLDEVAGELRLLDGSGVDRRAVQPVRREVEEVPAQPQEEDWETLTKARKYGALA